MFEYTARIPTLRPPSARVYWPFCAISTVSVKVRSDSDEAARRLAFGARQ